jgi:hypothetical protein
MRDRTVAAVPRSSTARSGSCEAATVSVPVGGQPERPSKVRDVHLKGVGGVRREMLAPYLVDQHLSRDRAAGPQEQRDQHRPWAASTEWDDGPGTPYFQRPEESELQVHRTPA